MPAAWSGGLVSAVVGDANYEADNHQIVGSVSVVNLVIYFFNFH
jgi:hypothetical protein